jgi:hypothetical protein
VLALSVVLACSQLWSQEGDPNRNDSAREISQRDHFVLKIGGLYEQGDFGTPSTTRVLFVPITFRYRGEKFDLSATPSVGLIHTGGDVVLIDGSPTPAGNTPASQTFGMGDTLIKGRLFLTDDKGSESAVPAITPFFKVKLPTGDPAKNLSTGSADYGFGFELDKEIRSALLFGDLGYTFIGQAAGLDLRQNRTNASFGLGKKTSDKLTITASLDWRQGLVPQAPDPVEVDGVISYKATPTTTISPNFFIGLTNGSSRFGAGVEFSFKFGRY